ncbi:MAG: HD-GYP domain-containing protein [Bacillota bacterium]
MNGISLKARIFVYSVIVLGFTLLLLLIYRMIGQKLDWYGLLIFAVLMIIADSLPINMPRGGLVTVSFALHFALILVYGPSIAVVVAVMSELITSRGRLLSSWYKALFNFGQLTLAIGGAGIVFQALGGVPGQVYPIKFIPIFATVLFYFFINTSTVATVIALVQKTSVTDMLRVNFRWALPNFLALAPTGYLIAITFKSAGLAGVVLFCIPLLLARHTFKLYTDMRQRYLETVQTLAVTIEAKDPYTHGHSERVSGYCVVIAREMGLAEDEIENLEQTARLHDIGKIAVSDNLLIKKNRLDPAEWEAMQRHPVVGAEITGNLQFYGKGHLAVRHHHEKWDGTGYPDRLQGEAIPLIARIMAVADAFDAMTSDRPYRKALTPDIAMEEIEACSGSQFDPKVVQAFVDVFPRLFGTSHCSVSVDGYAAGPLVPDSLKQGR